MSQPAGQLSNLRATGNLHKSLQRRILKWAMAGGSDEMPHEKGQFSRLRFQFVPTLQHLRRDVIWNVIALTTSQGIALFMALAFAVLVWRIVKGSQ